MPEIYQYVFDYIYNKIKFFQSTNEGKSLLKNRDVEISNEYQENPKSFPYITIIEFDNSYKDSVMEKEETETLLSYEISIYDNKTNKINVTNKLASLVNETMSELGFRRTIKTAIPNIADAKVYRQSIRFAGSYNSEVNKIYKF